MIYRRLRGYLSRKLGWSSRLVVWYWKARMKIGSFLRRLRKRMT